MEGNTTFYNTPTKEVIQKWSESVPKGFKFCFKFPKEITHTRMLHDVEDYALQFCDLFDSVREKLGPFMIQLPPSFDETFLFRLEKLLSILPKTLSYAVEVRHRDFFDRGNHEHNLNSLLKSYGVDRVIFDTRKLHATKAIDESIIQAQRKKPKVPVRFDAMGTRPIVRYAGTNDPLNNETYLKEWAIVIADWINEGLHPYVFIHSPDKISQPKLCAYFHSLLSELIDLPSLPEWPVNRESQLGLF